MAGVVHEAGLPLIVDAAWAAHFGFHPQLPPHPIAAGADAMVTSAHKALTAYSQAALVLARTQRIEHARLESAFEATHTTSPAGSILASIDAARALLQLHGKELLGRAISLVEAARSQLAEVEGLVVLAPPLVEPAKLVLVLPGTGADGILVERELISAGVPVEMADRDYLVPIVTMADTEESVRRLVAAVVRALRAHAGPPRELPAVSQWVVEPEPVITPREAYFAAHQVLPIREAIGRVSVELIAPYPPGVPVLAPGERVTAEIVDSLLASHATGTRIAYAADPSLATLRVVA
jgi:lysine decarboxylase